MNGLLGILIWFSFLTNDLVDNLNLLKRENMECTESQLKDFRFDCAASFYVEFLDAKLLSKKNQIYELSGFIKDYGTDNFVIKYGSIKADICEIETIGKNDSTGHFNVKVKINADKFIIFESYGFKSVYILLNLDK